VAPSPRDPDTTGGFLLHKRCNSGEITEAEGLRRFAEYESQVLNGVRWDKAIVAAGVAVARGPKSCTRKHRELLLKFLYGAIRANNTSDSEEIVKQTEGKKLPTSSTNTWVAVSGCAG
jgi:hypothetical protein